MFGRGGREGKEPYIRRQENRQMSKSKRLIRVLDINYEENHCMQVADYKCGTTKLRAKYSVRACSKLEINKVEH